MTPKKHDPQRGRHHGNRRITMEDLSTRREAAQAVADPIERKRALRRVRSAIANFKNRSERIC